MNSSMVNMAYLADMLPNVTRYDNGNISGLGEGLALRRATSGSYLDSITVVPSDQIIDTKFWSRFREKPLLLVQDAPMLTLYTPQFMTTSGMTASDFSAMLAASYSPGDIYINSVRVVKKDIICKNGYIHVLQDVALPTGTMAEVIDTQADTKIFKQLLDKFCAPYYDQGRHEEALEYYDGSTPMRQPIAGLGATDSIFTKRYFNENTASEGPNGENLANYGMLYYDPNQPTYSSEQDMGVMFVPSDEAMNDYFNGSEGGYLRDAYGTWDNVPTDIVAMFIKNHQKKSFKASLPHLWGTLTDETSYALHISQANVVRAIPANNGMVYVINKVLPPIDYKGTYAPALTADNTTVMKWALTDDWSDLGDSEAMRFYMYLRSMENMYNLLIPTDEALHAYRDPVAWSKGGDSREIWDFKYEPSRNRVVADVYPCDEQGNITGNRRRQETNKGVIRNRMRDIIDMHIVVGTNDGSQLGGYIDDGTAQYRLTKGGATIKVEGRGDQVSFIGGGDMELGIEPWGIAHASTGDICRYDSQNGRTFFIDHVLQDPTSSVYDILSTTPEFSTFFELCNGDEGVTRIFDNDIDFVDIFSTKHTTTSSAAGPVVNSFNNYRYTVLVPTNEALAAAFAADPKLCTWQEIANDANIDTKKEKALYLLKFLRYHFVDNSAYISGQAYGPLKYETGARNDYNKFHKVTIQSDGRSLNITDARGDVAHVLTSSGRYNIMARDLILNNSDPTKANEITASSRAVLHLIDHVLNYK